jgi:rare lipoprotein A
MRTFMRKSIITHGLSLLLLIALPTGASSRGFDWFFAHSRPEGDCSGQRVVATFYSSGGRTASGQAFHTGANTAAHRTLPFGSQVTVTNPRNGKSVTVVRTAAPTPRGVTIDLASGAAHAIGMTATQWVCKL